MWHIPPLITFSTINNKSTSVNRAYFTFFFYKAAYHVNPGAVKKRAGLSSYNLRHIFRKLSNRSAINSNHFEHINHDIPYVFYFKIFKNSFLRAFNLHH